MTFANAESATSTTAGTPCALCHGIGVVRVLVNDLASARFVERNCPDCKGTRPIIASYQHNAFVLDGYKPEPRRNRHARRKAAARERRRRG